MFAQKIKMSIAKVSHCFNPLFNPDFVKCFPRFILLPPPVLTFFLLDYRNRTKGSGYFEKLIVILLSSASIEGVGNTIRELWVRNIMVTLICYFF
ncbi:hypothetical protein MSLAZ_0411 [Methanosarcina lacustris Z-7289]|uniref:Uncharacterized protein n=1 Tax=Methanosarcina lacustris Z-7289 TaxID=1434111 RepID=A0A0E3S3K8_9EURY|nr:hypothetical protein MSLAZ_0411 [Methanosarcina lacustris Z-7289]